VEWRLDDADEDERPRGGHGEGAHGSRMLSFDARTDRLVDAPEGEGGT
jgi:hypothetical protein